MFDYSMLHWITFFTAVVLLDLSPGPDMAFMLGQTVRNGRKSGFAALLGSLVATVFHIAMAAIGLSAIIATSAVAFSICLLYTSPSPRDRTRSRMPSSA